jgi:hypothetical protein
MRSSLLGYLKRSECKREPCDIIRGGVQVPDAHDEGSKNGIAVAFEVAAEAALFDKHNADLPSRREQTHAAACGDGTGAGGSEA